MTHKTEMWQVYRFQDVDVTVIQQWVDPFGRPMLRFGLDRDGEVLAAGLPEAEFLAEATLLAEAGSELVEGAR
ncbi:hypothetical protein KM176_06790 [Pseudooceanicola sp. CBS1P-1]|uniref:Uncharacterized protein n=1 Tax=Pseudooceanicola albus TaxID=2692189 RepID=A0A6L7G134_9RHOB|nr:MULTISPECIES: hypothetical protein [Pseudooceanicola]MBT9383557.1 hypothetical protein [Pseudooceanicola endophyticus]MXN17412.1 hypothetical protein [Pseudooceanicola albus]